MLQNFNQLLDYIEEHLTEDISADKIAKITGISDYHFRRMFAYLAGMPLSEYIRNRRLASANSEIITGAKITDTAFKYGYQSVEGFSRAFRDWTGHLPSEAAKNHIQKTFPKFSFFIDIRGGISMEVKIEKKQGFHLIGVTKTVPIQFEGENPAINELAQSITEQQRKEMHEFNDLYPHQVLNASYAFDEGRMEEKGTLTHLIGFATAKENSFADLEQVAVEAHTWAIFPSKGAFPEALQETWGKIYAEWLPSSGYELVEAPEISFVRRDGSEEVYSEIWIAVKEK